MGRREEGEDTSQALGKDDYRKPESLDSYRFFEGRLESGTRFQQRNRADSQDFEDFGWFLRVNWMGSAEPNPYITPTVQ